MRSLCSLIRYKIGRYRGRGGSDVDCMLDITHMELQSNQKVLRLE